MSDVRVGVFAGTLEVLGRFLYKLMLAIAIVWIVGLVVGLFVGSDEPSTGGGGPPIHSTP